MKATPTLSHPLAPKLNWTSLTLYGHLSFDETERIDFLRNSFALDL